MLQHFNQTSVRAAGEVAAGQSDPRRQAGSKEYGAVPAPNGQSRILLGRLGPVEVEDAPISRGFQAVKHVPG
ncbi:MAG: hypothetical protein HS114_24975 [Anaerolineales bacterium]|nr:hypothetical protein [Anaerolineales bacterium]